jgi:hypothetical protein
MSYTYHRLSYYIFGKCVATNDENVSIRFCLGVSRGREIEDFGDEK